MRLAIMQPYFLPYVGYWNLMAAADAFVLYDNIQYTKKGWVTRNNMLVNGVPSGFSLRLAAAPHDLDIWQRYFAPDFDRGRLLRKFEGAYRNAPHFDETMTLLDDIINYRSPNLFQFLHYSIAALCCVLRIKTQVIVSSSISHPTYALRNLKGKYRVLATCEALGARTYLNPPGGAALYDRAEFAARGVELKFVRPLPFEYKQFGGPFIPWLSIIDLLMFNPAKRVREVVHHHYEES